MVAKLVQGIRAFNLLWWVPRLESREKQGVKNRYDNKQYWNLFRKNPYQYNVVITRFFFNIAKTEISHIE